MAKVTDPKPKVKPSLVVDVLHRCNDVFPAEWAGVRTLLAIDPGLQGTGVALWQDGVLIQADVLNVGNRARNWSWPARADLLADQVDSYLAEYSFDPDVTDRENSVVVCEYPEAFGGVKMMGWKTGDLQKLSYLVGLFSGRVHPARFVPVLVHEWKGQLPKHVVESRLTRILGKPLVKTLDIKLHAWDAVGIGMWARGEF